MIFGDKTVTRRTALKHNVGGLDRTLRIIAGLAVIGWGIFAQSWWGAIGLVFLITGLVSWCPAYLPFGLSSSKTES